MLRFFLLSWGIHFFATDQTLASEIKFVVLFPSQGLPSQNVANLFLSSTSSFSSLIDCSRVYVFQHSLWTCNCRNIFYVFPLTITLLWLASINPWMPIGSTFNTSFSVISYSHTKHFCNSSMIVKFQTCFKKNLVDGETRTLEYCRYVKQVCTL